MNAQLCTCAQIPTFILAAEYIARERAREAALQLADVTPEVGA